MLRLDGGLFFATAEALENRIRGLVDERRVRALVLDLEGVNFVDSQGSAKLTEIHELPRCRRRRASASRGSSRRCSPCSQADGVVDRIGADHIHGNVHRAVEAELAVDPSVSDEAGDTRRTPW